MEKKHNPCRKNSMSTLNVHVDVAKHYYMYILLRQAVTEYMHVQCTIKSSMYLHSLV